MQDSTHVIPAIPSSDSPRISSADTTRAVHPDTSRTSVRDTTFRRPARRMVPLGNKDSLAEKQLPAVVMPGKASDSLQHLPGKSAASSQAAPALKMVDFYHGHALVPEHHTAVPRQPIAPIWFFPILLFTLAVITWLRMHYTRYFVQIFQAFLKNNLANQIVRDENILVQRASIYLTFTFNIILSLFLYQASLALGWTVGGIGPGFYRFFLFAVIVSSVYTLKFLVLKTCGWLFDLDREMATYLFNIFLINHMLGIVLIPMIALLAFNRLIPPGMILNITIALIALAFLYRLIRGLMIGISIPGFSSLYLFLYLCTLEIAPLLVLIRVISL